MQWDIIIGPVLGAVIGYVTNKIAVEMLFHPINPIYIGKFRVPFTPGIIPKGKGRFAKAIGNVVGKNLLDTESMKATLLSPEKEEEIGKQLDVLLLKLSEDDGTLKERINKILGESVQEKLETNIVESLTQKINNELITRDAGQIIALEVTAAIQDKVQGTMLAMFIKPAVLEPIAETIKDRINQYIADHGEEKVNSLVKEEYDKLNGQSISALTSRMNTAEVKDMLLKAYRMAVTNYSDSLLASLNLANIAEEKVNAMDTKEVEELVLSIMKNELGAVVNLGAVIGLLLGLINLFF
jgi:uncharacterized membrane protein YheB (UPF0754 family)